MSQVARQARAYLWFLEHFDSLEDGMLVHRNITTSIKFAGIHLYTWMEKGTVRVECLA